MSPSKAAKTVTLTSEGLNEITVRATDAAGNVDEKVVFVDVSWTEPLLAVEFIKSTNGTVPIVGTVIGDNIVLYVIHNSASDNRTQTYLVGESGEFMIALDLEEGQNTLFVRAIDSYGNINETDSYTFDYTPFTESTEEEGKVDLLDVGIVVLAFGLALFVMVFMLGWVRNRYRG